MFGETRSLEEASTSRGPDVGPGIESDATSRVTINQRPGLHEVVCDMPWHYSQAMMSALRVSELFAGMGNAHPGP